MTLLLALLLALAKAFLPPTVEGCATSCAWFKRQMPELKINRDICEVSCQFPRYRSLCLPGPCASCTTCEMLDPRLAE